MWRRGRRSSARPAGRPRPGRLTRLGPPLGAGRWSLVPRPPEPGAPLSTATAHAVAAQLLERCGVVTREGVLADGVRGGFAAVYPVLKAMEERGQVRRGYFVSGLGAAQFALPGAVDRLRVPLPTDVAGVHRSDPVVLAATDPAQPYGSVLEWPGPAGRVTRTATAVVVLRDGTPLAWLDRRGHHLVTFDATSTDGSWAGALAALVSGHRVRSLEIRKVDGAPLDLASLVADLLRGAGFVEGYRGMSLRP